MIGGGSLGLCTTYRSASPGPQGVDQRCGPVNKHTGRHMCNAICATPQGRTREIVSSSTSSKQRGA